MKSWSMITGAAGGLGKAFAVESASRGWNLFLTDLYESDLEALACGLAAAYGIETVTHTCDLADPVSRDGLFGYIHSQGLYFDGLINVAGMEYEGPFLERSREQVRSIIRLNIEGTLEMTHALLSHRHPLKTFRIITVSSLAAFYPMPLKATYAASKRFLLDFFLALREELSPLGATVTVLCPAGLPTTERALRGIKAQGLMGLLTTQNVGRVAQLTIDQALKGRAVVVPGLLNRLLQGVGALVPSRLVAALVGRRWKGAHKGPKYIHQVHSVLASTPGVAGDFPEGEAPLEHAQQAPLST